MNGPPGKCLLSHIRPHCRFVKYYKYFNENCRDEPFRALRTTGLVVFSDILPLCCLTCQVCSANHRQKCLEKSCTETPSYNNRWNTIQKWNRNVLLRVLRPKVIVLAGHPDNTHCPLFTWCIKGQPGFCKYRDLLFPTSYGFLLSF